MSAMSFRPSVLSPVPSRFPVLRETTMSLGVNNLRFTQVISDVDDTLKSSGGVSVGGVALGGIDVQYDRGDFYPGVGEFMLALSQYGLMEEANPAKIAILTARAEEFKAALEIKEGSKLAVALRSAGEKAGIDGWGVSTDFAWFFGILTGTYAIAHAFKFCLKHFFLFLENPKLGWTCSLRECCRMDRTGSEGSSKIHKF